MFSALSGPARSVEHRAGFGSVLSGIVQRTICPGEHGDYAGTAQGFMCPGTVEFDSSLSIKIVNTFANCELANLCAHMSLNQWIKWKGGKVLKSRDTVHTESPPPPTVLVFFPIFSLSLVLFACQIAIYFLSLFSFFLSVTYTTCNSFLKGVWKRWWCSYIKGGRGGADMGQRKGW